MKCVMVILNYKDAKRALQLAEKCCTFSSIEKVIIVDNNSLDNSAEYLRSKKNKEIDLCIASENKGFAAGNNIGAKYGIAAYKPEYILFANTDTIFEDKEILACIEALDFDKTIGLISMRIKNINGEEERSAWKYKSFVQYLLFNFWIYRHFTYKKDRYIYSTEKKTQFVDMVRGSFMMFRTEALEKAGYFDEETFLYYEEECISYRLKQKGYKVGILTNYFYIHNHISSNIKNKYSMKEVMDQSLIHFLKRYYKVGKIKMKVFCFAVRISSAESRVLGIIKSKKQFFIRRNAGDGK